MLKTLGAQIKEYKLSSILTPVAMVAEVIMEMIIPLLMASIIDKGVEAGDMNHILKVGAVMVAAAAGGLLFGMLGGIFGAHASTGFAKNLRAAMFRNIQTFSFANIDRFSTAGLITRLTTDVTNVQMAYQMLLRMFVRAPITMVVAMCMSFYISPRLATVYLVAVILLGSFLAFMMTRVGKYFRQVFRKYDDLNASVQENVSAIRVVKAYVRENYEREKFRRASENVYNLFVKAEKLVITNMPVMMGTVYTCILLISWLGAKMIVANDLTTGELMSLLAYCMNILMSLMMMSMVFVMVTMSSASGERIAEVLNEKSLLVNPENPDYEIPDGSVTFDHVYFRYQGKPADADGQEAHAADTAGREADAASSEARDSVESSSSADEDEVLMPASSAGKSSAGRNSASSESASAQPSYVLRDINFHVRSGETIGIIGGTGSSKSTLVNLISRLYDVSEGSVKVGGKDVRTYDLNTLRNNVSVVLQKNVLFSGTIYENLRWGNKDATDEECRQAARLACADEFIQQFPDGYNTYIEQGGSNVSGGQKQRLCIARALLKHPKILILDDSTSAVDTATDARIRRAFREEIPDTTKFIIAQRIASVMDADRILVMDNGEVKAFGTHAELLQTSAIYREVYESQMNAGGDFDRPDDTIRAQGEGGWE